MEYDADGPVNILVAACWRVK